MRHPDGLTLTGAAVFFALSVAGTAPGQEAGTSSRRTVSVTGHGEVDATPDLAVISFSIETTGTKAADAIADNARRADAVIKAVRSTLGKDDRVATTRYSLEPRYEQTRRGEGEQPRIVGYVARNEVRVETRAVDALGSLIDTATAAGANRVANLQFTLSKKNEHQGAAIEGAATDARAQAESIARGLGVKLIRIVAATTSSGPVVPMRRFDYGMMAAEARSPTPIEPGTVSVSATLTVTWEIE